VLQSQSTTSLRLRILRLIIGAFDGRQKLLTIYEQQLRFDEGVFRLLLYITSTRQYLVILITTQQGEMGEVVGCIRTEQSSSKKSLKITQLIVIRGSCRHMRHTTCYLYLDFSS
jgi:hypothetical protein